MGVSTFLAPHLVEWYTDIYRNVYGIDHTYTDIVLKFNTYFKQLVNNTVLTTFSNIILTIGLCLMLLYFFTDLSSKAVMKQLSQLQVWKSFSVLILSVLVIYNAKYIFVLMLTVVEGISSMGDVKSGSVAISKFLSSDVVQLLLSRCVGEHFSLWSIIGYTFSGFILELANLAVKAMLIYYAATRTLQLFVYYIFAPIGVADIFENGPGGTINFRSSGFRYLKTVFAIMLQIVVISVVCNVYPLVVSAVNVGYFTDQGDTSINSVGIDKAMFYPLRKMQYTDHESTIRETIANGLSNIKEKIDALSSFLSDDEDDAGDGTAEDSQTKEKLKDSEKYRVLNVIGYDGKPKEGQEEEVKKIYENNYYRMTIESTELFFDWCVGADSSKIVLLIILLITKGLLIVSASKICNYIVGVSI